MVEFIPALSHLLALPGEFTNQLDICEADPHGRAKIVVSTHPPPSPPPPTCQDSPLEAGQMVPRYPTPDPNLPAIVTDLAPNSFEE